MEWLKAGLYQYGDDLRLLFIMMAIAAATLVGCATPLVEHSRSAEPEVRPCCRSVTAVPSRRAVARTAANLVGAKTIAINGRTIGYDCAGVTRAIFLRHGIDLYEGGPTDPRANGVRLIYEHVRRYGRLHRGPTVQPGDLVFFDNTWDFNGDGKLNDPLTHVGVVEQIESDGTVVFISRVADAIARYRMNLAFPHIHKNAEGRIHNDFIRRKLPSDPPRMTRLTGQLFSSFGTRLAR